MDSAEFRTKGKEMVDYISNYIDTIRERRVTPDVEPCYLRFLLPSEAPQDPESWDTIMSDVDKKIMPGITHWNHPQFHAYFPSGNSYPAILGDMLSSGIACYGFSWAASPACSELENIVLDWFGKAIGLPEEFLSSGKAPKGGGALEASASDCIFVAMVAARAQIIRHLKGDKTDVLDSSFLPKLVAYTSEESHSCVEKNAKILMIQLRILETDDMGRLPAATLKKAMEDDVAKGLVPFFVSCILGSTGSCNFDNLEELGPVCRSFPYVWMHVDAAYVGNAFICPELRPYLAGIQYADSFNTNPNKWLLVNFDCSCLWVRDRTRLTSAMVVNPLYLENAFSEENVDYRHWTVQLSRRFRSLKLWFVLRRYGISGLQKYIRNHIKLAKVFESLVRTDDRFEVTNTVRLGLVCFRLKGSNCLNKDLLDSIMSSGKLHMVPALFHRKFIIRFLVVAEHACEADMEFAWKVIQEHATKLLNSRRTKSKPKPIAPGKQDPTAAFVNSFTLSVPQNEFLNLSRSILYDGAKPVLISEDDDLQDTEMLLNM